MCASFSLLQQQSELLLHHCLCTLVQLRMKSPSNSPTIYRSMLINSEVMLLIMNNPNDGSFQVKSEWISFLTECTMKIPLQPCTYCSCRGSEISNLRMEKRNCFLLQFQLCTISVSTHTGLMKEKPRLVLKSVD